MSDLSCAILCNFEFSFLQVCEKIASRHMFQNNKDLIWVLKNIKKFDNIGMLAYFKHLNLSLLKL